MIYYEYNIDYNPKQGSSDVVAVPKKMSKRALLEYLQDEGMVEPMEPRWFEKFEITEKDFKLLGGVE